MELINGILILTGLALAIAYDDLSQNKIATQSTTAAGPPNAPNTFVASNAVDRNITTCMRAKGIGLTSEHKFEWWKVDLGGVYNIYSINIIFKNYQGYEMRQQGRFAGFSLYVTDDGLIDNGVIDSSSRCYKDGPHLPSLNFTTTCISSGRYVIFYNERISGVKYPENYQLENILTELCEVIMMGCQTAGVYGESCEKRCPTNCRDNTCHIQNGTCFGCSPGWNGTMCHTECSEGWYGLDCKLLCSGHCRDNAVCNHVTGVCKGGCAAGWNGTLCDKECEDGSYGYNCVHKCSSNCLHDFPCNKTNGHCEQGCKPGYSKPLCDKHCSTGFYGNSCTEPCSKNCLNSLICDHIDGTCSGGCQAGFVGKLCNSSCKDGYYGINCSGVCPSHCRKCNPTDGTCSCYAGWTGSNCSIACSKSYGEDCQYQCSPSCINQTCDRFNGTCLTTCLKESHGDKCSTDHQDQMSDITPVAVGGTLSACVILIIVVAVFVIRYKRKSAIMKKMSPRASKVKQRMTMQSLKRKSYLESDSPQIVNADEADDSTPTLPERPQKGPSTNQNIPIRNIKAQIANMSAKENSGFKSEYNEIPRGELSPCLEAKKPENKVKNRYTTIHPYDHSRVVLTSLNNDGYINANYIEDTKGNKAYIATQGPKPKTIADFWTLISQEEVTVIVCLTNLKEGAKNKCAQYWPNVNDKLQGGNITVRHLGESTYAEHIIRRFKIHNKLKQQDCVVTMFHYTAWADHGVADPLSLVVFHRQVMKATAKSSGKYTLVHCSAGVGRTGTYIALDALYREGQNTGKINVPLYVKTMRKDRMNMIQGEEQYKLLYLALMEAFRGPSRCVPTQLFLSEYQQQDCYTNCGNASKKSTLSSEFEELLSLRKVYSQKDYESGRAHITANYTQSVLPVEEYMCHLSYSKGHNTYYNAILLQSFLEKDCIISAQYPLPDYSEDLLRLVRDFNARIVVFLCPIKDLASSSAWFPTKTQVKFVGDFTIKHVSEAKGSNVTMTKLVLQSKENSDIRITVLECPTWREGQSTADKRVLLDVIKEVKTEKTYQEGRILVQSSDGATRCGPFCVVYNALEQITVDREVDIFTIARQLQVRRPEFVSILEEYQLCYDTVGEYLLNDCVYGNV
uniref:protein-tyrosine-phosphatase n=1 Tax=Crassostrea virginica TaxID=6565 RepID=A0A8B8C7L4_CRAVI|nr:receptor-type tyrosine-protein phosphatase epsilon-like isoform X1 [Crassostrea virginica]